MKKASDESSVNQEAAAEKTDGDVAVEDPFAEDVVDETPEFAASVDQEINTKVETNHPETVVGREGNEFGHLPLAQEERIRAREEELELISAKATFPERKRGERSGRVRSWLSSAESGGSNGWIPVRNWSKSSWRRSTHNQCESRRRFVEVQAGQQ